MRREVLPLAACVLSALFLCLSVQKISGTDTKVIVPVTYDAEYHEDAEGYESQFRDDYDWDKVVPSEGDAEYVMYLTSAAFSDFTTYAPDQGNYTLRYQTQSDIAIASLSDADAWTLCSGGIFNEYPNVPYSKIKTELGVIRNTSTETVTVKCWYWEDPEDDTNMNKVTTSKTFAVNAAIADMFLHIFEDIYAHPSQPVINIADSGMGTWVLRGKNHNSSNTLSAHSLGTAIDINPSSGSYYVNGKWYGNAYNQSPMPTAVWVQLPETHRKYHVLYEDSPIVQVFKAYGWYWGGDWNSTPDPMHLAFLGDGGAARKTGYKNLLEGR